jgi:hypothetical protein
MPALYLLNNVLCRCVKLIALLISKYFPIVWETTVGRNRAEQSLNKIKYNIHKEFPMHSRRCLLPCAKPILALVLVFYSFLTGNYSKFCDVRGIMFPMNINLRRCRLTRKKINFFYEGSHIFQNKRCRSGSGLLRMQNLY